MTNEPTNPAVAIDHPISDAADDSLQRLQLAESFARRVLSLPATQGLVVGVFGPWGSGKTSFINLARTTFNNRNIPVLDFNPWMFSNAEQLVERFFSELSAQLRLHKLKQLGEALDEYSTALTGPLRSWLKVGGIYLRRRSGGLSERRDKIEQALSSRLKPIIVVVDDVDRLSGSETRAMFKLVRLTANFPNIVYIVACDRKRVEHALDGDGVVGRDYLGKIIQLPFDLPEIPRQLFKDQTIASIQTTLNRLHDPGPFHEHEWPDIFEQIIRPLMRNVRDLRRYCVAVQGTADSLEGAVACVDMLALEAVRLFLPDVFLLLPAAQHDLTVSPGAEQISKDFDAGFASVLDRSDVDKLPSNPRIDAMLETGHQREEIIRTLIRRLFPQAALFLPGDQHVPEFSPSQMLQERRVGHELVLRLYLERVADQDLLDSYDAEQAFARLADRDSLEEFLLSRDTQLQNVIHHLRDYKNEFQSEHAEPASIVLLNLLPHLPQQSVPLLDHAQRLIGSIVTSLLRALDGASAREQAVNAILPELTSLSAKVTLIHRIGHMPNIGKKLVSEGAAAKYEMALATEIRAHQPEKLAEDRNPALIISFAQQHAEESGDTFTIPDSPKLTLALLHDCQTEAHLPTLGSSSHPKTIKGPGWRNLKTLYGSNAILKQRISTLNSNLEKLKTWIHARMDSVDEAQKLVERVEKHLRTLQDD